MSEPKTEPKPRRRLPWWISASWLILMIDLYTWKPGVTTAITIWPAWIALFIGLGLAAFARCQRQNLLLFWLIFGFMHVDEFDSLPRMVGREPKRDFRVVTLNCAGGSLLAAEEVIALKPDLVLFQESPSRRDLEEVALKLFGPKPGVVWGPDASIVARGSLTAHALPKTVSNFVAASWSPEKGKMIDVVSLRLAPPVMRIDLYSWSAWTEFARNREARAKETQEMADILAELRLDPQVLGGDFNSPPDRRSLGYLTARKSDAFKEAGVGLGATCVNPMPCIVRIDQIWSGSKIKPVSARVIKTEHSDHRMLVADYVWQ